MFAKRKLNIRRTYENKVFGTQLRLRVEIIKSIVELKEGINPDYQYIWKRYNKEVEDLQRFLDRFDKKH